MLTLADLPEAAVCLQLRLGGREPAAGLLGLGAKQAGCPLEFIRVRLDSLPEISQSALVVGLEAPVRPRARRAPASSPAA
jgi:hypothetical protein